MTPIERAVAIVAASLEQSALLSPREAALRAHYAGGPSVDEIERRIVARRAREAMPGGQQ